jgi:hypothetical protein
MPSDRKKLRGLILTEDRRTQRFFKNLLVDLGFDRNRLRFVTAPSGKGNAALWVRSQYPDEVRLLRTKNYQQGLFLVAVRDGDNIGVRVRKADLDNALREAGLVPRNSKERIATPVPTWSIETWLLALLGDDDVDELSTRKQDFENEYRENDEETKALLDAAKAWRHKSKNLSLPSLADSKSEMKKLDSA